MTTLPARPRLAFLASHNGTNMRAIVAACRDGRLTAEPVLLVSNNRDGAAMAWARENNLPAQHISATALGSEAAADEALAAVLKASGADLVIMAGYMRKLGPVTLAAFRRRILNVHPSLLPRFGGHGMYGRHVHEAVLAAGVGETGATIHLVDEVFDQGPILAQAKVAVERGDTVATLTARVQAREQTLYLETLGRIVSGEIDLDTF